MTVLSNFSEELKRKPFIQSIINDLSGEVFAIGGVVRDLILNKSNKDIDLVVRKVPINILTQQLQKFGKVDAVGKSFGVLKFVDSDGLDYDIALPRTDKKNDKGGYRGFDVQSDENLPIEADLERRDAKMNAMAMNLNSGKFIDPLGGLDDIENKEISAANPEAFSDDPLRMLRIVGFASRFGFTIEPKTMEMISDNAAKIKEIAPERILIELDKIVTKGNALIGVQLLADTGLYFQIFGNQIQASQIGRRDFSAVRTMAEFLFLLMSGVVQNPSEFYLSRFATTDAKRDKVYKELQALEFATIYEEMTPVKARSVAHNMFKTAPQILQSQILPEVIRNAAQELLQGKYPKTVNELAVNGNDLMNKGLSGKQLGETLKSMLIQIYADNIRNSREDLLSLVDNKNSEIKENYSNYSDMQPSTWDINGEEVGIDFFVREYDNWNTQDDNKGYQDATRLSVLEFLQNNYEDESTDEKLKKELYWVLTDRDLLKKESERTEKVEYGALMLYLDIPNWNKITSVIKDDDIYEVDNEFGIETEAHVTIFYGFHKEVKPDEVFKLYQEHYNLKPIEFKINGISIFENDDFDVVKIDVESKILTKINKLMREFPSTITFPTYHAHITLAYVKKGSGKKYVKKFNEERVIIGNKLVFSSKKEKKKTLNLNVKGILNEENISKNTLNEMSLNSINYNNVVTPKYIEDLKLSDNFERYLEHFQYEYGIDDIEDVEKHEDFKEWFEGMLYRRYEEVVNNIEDKIKSDGTIDIWREMTVDENWLSHVADAGKHLGIYWSWDERAAEAHWSRGKIPVTMKTSVREVYINWEETIELNMDYSLGEEKEIRLFKNTELKIEELYVNGVDVMDTPEAQHIKNKTFLAEEDISKDDMKKINYSAVILDKKSHDSLIKVFQPMIPNGWEVIAHHMTIKMGGLNTGSKEKQDMEAETQITLNVTDYAIDDLVMAVGVEGYPTTNAKSHITIAVNQAEGGKPFYSNKLTDWKPLGFPLTLTGKVKEE